MKRILIPTDLSDLGDFAYDLANKIAQPTQSEIHILTIVPAAPGVLFDKAGYVKDVGDVDLTALYDKEKEVKEKAATWSQGKQNITVHLVKIGMVEEDILRYVKENKIDLVVMGTSGSFGIEEKLRGSHTGHISQQSPVPVLSLKCDRSEIKIKDLLLVSDFHKVEKMNLGALKNLQDAFDANLNLLKVNTPNDFEPQRQVISKMQKFAELNLLGDVYCHVYSDETVEKGIVNFSADTGIDFVLMGTHQRGAISRLFKKSISNEIVNHIWQPVLTFPI